MKDGQYFEYLQSGSRQGAEWLSVSRVRMRIVQSAPSAAAGEPRAPPYNRKGGV